MLQRAPGRVYRGLKKMAHLMEMKAHRWLGRPMGERLVFVGGAPRSGTTLVQLILDAHPAVFGGPEFDCLPDIIQAWRRTAEDHERGRINAFCARIQIDTCFANLIEHLLLPAADRHNARLLSEKTPVNVFAFSGLLQILPQCRAIHVVRDPRAVVASMLKVGKRCREKGGPIADFTQNLQAAIHFTKQCLDAGFAATKLFPGRVHTVVYEALVHQPQPLVERLCSFLELPFDDRMLQPEKKEHPEYDVQIRADDGRWNEAQGFRAIESSRVDAWRDAFDHDQISAVNCAFKDDGALRDLGYIFE
jgi:protein-tyrosine sulfotransferase